VAAVSDLQPLQREEPEPQERGHRIRISRIFRPALRRLKKRFLDHIGRVNAATHALIQAERHHVPQPSAVGRQELSP